MSRDSKLRCVGIMIAQAIVLSFIVGSTAPAFARPVAGRAPIGRLPGAQMSFNLQYLQLQSAMQNDNRQYTAVSNIMKTKHDTVKNTISNIR
jgi:hypothetical protein